MTTHMIIGCVLIIGALSAIVVLVLWSRGAINRIASEQIHSARDILRERTNGR